MTASSSRRPHPALPAVLLLGAVAVATAAGGTPTGDPEAAARQYRLARRLAAEGSADAAGAFAKVIELDPHGPLADDAILDQALLLGLPDRPEEMGRLGPSQAERALGLIGKLLKGFPASDRAAEASYRKAMLRLEPLPGRDPARARIELLAVATGKASERWRTEARYAVAWLDEQAGETERARNGWQRLAVDDPTSSAGERARASAGVLLLRNGEFGRAAALLQEAIDAGVDTASGVRPLRELAIRGALRAAGSGGRWADGTPAAVQTGLRSATALTLLRDGSTLLADRRSATVVRIDARGEGSARWSLEDVEAVTEDPFGRVLVAAGERIYRLEPSGPVEVSGQGALAPVSAICADAGGRIWLLDRKGERLGRIEVGSSAPTVVGAVPKGSRLASLTRAGTKAIALDTRLRRVVEITADGAVRALFSVEAATERPSALASDPAGQIALLDEKNEEVLLLSPSGELRDRFPARAAGLEDVVSIALGADGSLVLLAGGGSTLLRVP